MSTGDHTGVTCETSLLRWHYEKSGNFADPAIAYPVSQVRIWDSTIVSDRPRIVAAWPEAYRRLAISKNKWSMVMGLMATTIYTSLDNGIKLVRPHVYHVQKHGTAYALKPRHDRTSCRRVAYASKCILERGHGRTLQSNIQVLGWSTAHRTSNQLEGHTGAYRTKGRRTKRIRLNASSSMDHGVIAGCPLGRARVSRSATSYPNANVELRDEQ